MTVNIRLRRRYAHTPEQIESDPLRRRWAGYDPEVSARQLWRHNRGFHRMAESSVARENYATLSFEGVVVAVVEIQGYERAEGGVFDGRMVLRGRPLDEDDPVFLAWIGRPIPPGRSVNYYPDPPVPDGGAFSRAFLLTWNPAHSDWASYRDAIAETGAGRAVEDNWSTGGRTSGINVGDRVFMLRQGSAERGIIAAGTVLHEIYSDAHWEDERSIAHYVDVLWDSVVGPADRLPIERLKACFPEQHWTPQSSGTAVLGDIADELGVLWSQHVGALSEPPDADHRAQGRLSHPQLRKLIEDAAQDRLMTHYRAQGWEVRDTRVGAPYDAIATRKGLTRYLEAKGTRSSGEAVWVTRGEVEHALGNPGRCVIGIWSGIAVDAAGKVDAESGSFVVAPFDPTAGTLTPVQFQWRHPYGEPEADRPD
ncbi:protein NO VEIN domain-containing protein [Nocardia sp. NPDC057353]|uniref:protein NO VEIN domain-containing protein n=1 Tax=Nocardia sp. NPDC057353 TaxID=3346104 RepID=UPI0036338534